MSRRRRRRGRGRGGGGGAPRLHRPRPPPPIRPTREFNLETNFFWCVRIVFDIIPPVLGALLRLSSHIQEYYDRSNRQSRGAIKINNEATLFDWAKYWFTTDDLHIAGGDLSRVDYRVRAVLESPVRSFDHFDATTLSYLLHRIVGFDLNGIAPTVDERDRTDLFKSFLDVFNPRGRPFGKCDATQIEQFLLNNGIRGGGPSLRTCLRWGVPDVFRVLRNFVAHRLVSQLEVHTRDNFIDLVVESLRSLARLLPAGMFPAGVDVPNWDDCVTRIGDCLQDRVESQLEDRYRRQLLESVRSELARRSKMIQRMEGEMERMRESLGGMYEDLVLRPREHRMLQRLRDIQRNFLSGAIFGAIWCLRWKMEALEELEVEGEGGPEAGSEEETEGETPNTPDQGVFGPDTVRVKGLYLPALLAHFRKLFGGSSFGLIDEFASESYTHRLSFLGDIINLVVPREDHVKHGGVFALGVLGFLNGGLHGDCLGVIDILLQDQKSEYRFWERAQAAMKSTLDNPDVLAVLSEKEVNVEAIRELLLEGNSVDFFDPLRFFVSMELLLADFPEWNSPTLKCVYAAFRLVFPRVFALDVGALREKILALGLTNLSDPILVMRLAEKMLGTDRFRSNV